METAISSYGIYGGKSGAGAVFILVLRFSPVNIIPPWPSKLGMKNRPVDGQSPGTVVHHIDINMANGKLIVRNLYSSKYFEQTDH
jgi:hypothetical protein